MGRAWSFSSYRTFFSSWCSLKGLYCSPYGSFFSLLSRSVSKNVSCCSQCLSQAAHKKSELNARHPHPYIIRYILILCINIGSTLNYKTFFFATLHYRIVNIVSMLTFTLHSIFRHVEVTSSSEPKLTMII